MHAVTLALAGIRRLLEADRRVRGGSWGFAELRPLHLPSALVAGVVGFGRIGRRVSELLLALGFDVVAHDPVAPIDASRVRESSLDDLLRSSDVVSLHAPAPDDGSCLIGARELALLPDGAVVINVSRGPIFDEDALIAALASGHLGGASLDVFRVEPLPADSPLWGMPNVMITPHASGTHDHVSEFTADLFLENLDRYVGGRPLLNLADRSRGY